MVAGKIIWAQVERMDKSKKVIDGKSHRIWLLIEYGNEGRLLSSITLLDLYQEDEDAIY